MKKNIALVAGGFSGESVVSIQSAITIENNIDSERYEVYKILISKAGWRYTAPDGSIYEVDKNDFTLNLKEGVIQFDAVFIGIHGTPGEDGRLQGYLDMLQIPYTSCGAVTSALTFNKSYCNKVVHDLGCVSVAPSVHLFAHVPYEISDILNKLSLPVFVKPAEGGSSIGMSKVTEPSQLEAAIQKAFQEDQQVLIESFIKGREVTCGQYVKDGVWEALPLTEIRTSKEFFDFEAKYTPGLTQELTPAPVTDEIAERIQQAAKTIYFALNCRGVVRTDFIVGDDGNLYFLEINTMPGQSENSIVPQQVRAAGKTLKEFYGTLIENCLRAAAQS